jgi:hypothetical protein
MVTPVVVIPVACTAEIVGGGVVVAKVKLPDVVDWLLLLVEATS